MPVPFFLLIANRATKCWSQVAARCYDGALRRTTRTPACESKRVDQLHFIRESRVRRLAVVCAIATTIFAAFAIIEKNPRVAAAAQQPGPLPGVPSSALGIVSVRDRK